MITKSIEGTYKRFVHWITQNRKKSFDELDNVGGGRVWSGPKAKEIGLADELGTLQDAIKFAANKANLKNYNVVNYPGKKNPFKELFSNMDEEDIESRFIKNKIGKENFRIYENFIRIKQSNSIMMELPYSISLN